MKISLRLAFILLLFRIADSLLPDFRVSQSHNHAPLRNAGNGRDKYSDALDLAGANDMVLVTNGT